MIELDIKWLVGLFITAFLSVLFRESAIIIFARILDFFHINQSAKLKGLWYCEYDFESKGKRHLEKQIVEVRQLGKTIWMQDIIKNHHSHKLTGKIKNENYLTGFWTNRSSGDLYYGTFQLFISRQSKLLTGKWLGFNDKNEIKSGDWHFKFLTELTSKHSKRSQIKKFKNGKLSNLITQKQT